MQGTKKATEIMIVDDEKATVDAFERFLGIEGFATISFCSAEEALDYLRQCGEEALPAIVITDYRMQEMSGLDLLVAIKTEFSAAKMGVILISGFLSHSKVMGEMYTLVDSFIEKPVSPYNILMSIKLIEAKK